LHFTLSDLIADIAQNGAEAGASLLELAIGEEILEGKPEFRFSVKDNGKGMTAEQMKKAQDPFVTDGVKHPKRKIGLGIPFLIQTAEMSGGAWDMQSEPGKGTSISAWFDEGNVDTPPMGDIPGCLRTVLTFEGPAEIVVHRFRKGIKAGGGEWGGSDLDYTVKKSELVDALGDLEDAESLVLLTKYLKSFEE
jgi:hypothetical protein